ncbi:MAG: glutamate--cysteine ligase [Moraxellaceae bacterium]|nr:glutamate--cysteine ligase [Moraxellaceae bacterium]
MDAVLAREIEWLSQRTPVLQGMRRGLEKESLRVQADGRLAQTPHHAGFGSALTHPWITTDYSEALIELITPATHSIAETLGFLDDIHRHVYAEMGDEQLWVNSMPCLLGEDADIPLAQYGRSNIGRMKTLYRRGLGVRYGRKMQTIAGIHYNLSFPDSFWQTWQEQTGNRDSLTDFRSAKYFGLVRNFQRQSWLLLYLLGASPAVCASFLRGREHRLQSRQNGTLFLPDATSLRMSSLGYQNSVQSELRVSYNGIADYVRDLDHAIRTPCAPFEAIGLRDASGEYQQINTHLLQIENEYYGLIRPKRTTERNERPTTALSKRGVEYVELRCVDLNPFHPIGIDSTSAHFLEVFALHCLLRDAPPFADSEYGCLPKNQQEMVERGRDPELELRFCGERGRFRDLASKLLTELAAVAPLLDTAHGTQDYSLAIGREALKLDDPALTYSATLLRELDDNDCSFFEFGRKTAAEHAEWFRQRPLEGARAAEFAAATSTSHAAQADIEAADTQSFDDFLTAWFRD